MAKNNYYDPNTYSLNQGNILSDFRNPSATVLPQTQGVSALGINANYGVGGYQSQMMNPQSQVNNTMPLTGNMGFINPMEVKESESQTDISYAPITGGSGLSSIGAGIGTLVGGPAGAVVGAGIGSLGDIAMNIIASDSARREARRRQRKIDLQNHRDRLYNQELNNINLGMKRDTHAQALAMGEVNLETAQMNLASEKHAKNMALVRSFFGTGARRIDPLTRGII